MTLKIFHIGLDGYGRLGFRELLEICSEEDIDAEVAGVFSRDKTLIEDALNTSPIDEKQVQVFQDLDEMYRKASEQNSDVFIYDTGSSDTHSDNLYRSLQHGFYHLAERPPSIKREEHLKERRLSEESDVTWKVDFIERENPAVKKALELLENEEINKIETHRYSSEAVEASLMPEKRRKLRGGTVLNKAINEIYTTDFLEKAGSEKELKLESVENEHFTPFRRGSDKLLSIEGGYTEEICGKTATADFSAVFSADNVEIEINAGIMGMTEQGLIQASKLKESTGHDFRHRDFIEADGEAFLDERAAFFVVEGSREIAGDLIEGELFDLETGKKLDAGSEEYTPLYRVIKDAIEDAIREEEEELDMETDLFMNALYDARDSIEGEEYMDELDKANSRLESMIISEDGKQDQHKEMPS